MDDTNERRVFDLVVETADSNSSQYFLFSPKLLRDLSYSNKMLIHVLWNGPNLDNGLACHNPGDMLTREGSLQTV